MADKPVFVVTCADEKPDKATIPFALGNSALAMDAEAKKRRDILNRYC